MPGATGAADRGAQLALRRRRLMQKAAPSFGRIAVMVAFALSCFALVLFLWLAFGGPIPLKPKGYRVSASFAEASQLATEADVRISGVPVGKVKTIEADAKTGRSLVTMELDAKYAPLPSDAKALLRQKTLLGETYVELTPGTEQAKQVPEGGRLPEGNVSETVALDEILRTFDPETRAAFQEWMQTQAQAIGGHGRDLNDALGNLGPFAEDAAELVDTLNRQEPAVRNLISNTGVVFEALTERNGQLRELIENSNTVFQTTAQRDRELQESFVALPTFERESRQTIDRLAQFARDTDPLVTQLRPAARELSPTLRDLSALAPDLEAFFRETNPLIDASRRGFPAAERILRDLRPLLAQLDPALRQLNPVLEALAFYPRELTAFFANTVAATQATTALPSGERLHYLRTANPFNAENLAVYPKRLPTNRPNPYALPGTFDQIREGMPQYETRHCGRDAFPTIVNTPQQIAPSPPLPELTLPVPIPVPVPDVKNVVNGAYQLPGQLFSDIVRFAFPAGPGAPQPAPPCKQQGKYPFQGELLQYPHVKAR
jgi:phospholipid/cholesterol/gamma-HCH transport system substrate-binding protein